MVQTSPSLRSRLAAELADMPPAHQRLSAFLLENLELSSDLTITELADRAGVSIGTISRLCRRFGCVAIRSYD